MHGIPRPQEGSDAPYYPLYTADLGKNAVADLG